MDLQSLYGNLHNFEDTKIFHKEIMNDSFKDKSYDLFSMKSSFIPDNNIDKYDNVDSD